MNTNQHDEADEGADTGAEDVVLQPESDLLVGEPAISAFVISLGMPKTSNAYYLKRTGWPIGNTGGDGTSKRGGKLIASKRRLRNFVERIARGPAAA